MPDGTVELFHFTHDRANQTTQVQRLVSTDGGSNWAVDSVAVLNEDIDASTYESTALSVAYQNGQYVLLTSMDNGANTLAFGYASRDLGYTFVAAHAPSGTGSDDFDAEVIAAGGYFVAITKAGGAGNVYFFRLGGAFGSWEYIRNWAGAAAGRYKLVLDDSGRIYLFSHSATRWSDDYGATWGPASPPNWFYGASDPENIGGTWSRGRAILVHNSTGSSGPTSMHVTQLGGVSNITMPQKAFAAQDADYYDWDEIYIAVDELDVVTASTASHVLIPTITVVDGYQRSNVPMASAAQWEDTGSVQTTMEMFARAVISTNNGTQYVALRSANGTDGWAARVQLSGVALQLYDDVSGATIGSAVTTIADQQIDILIAVVNGTTGNNDGSVYCWYRTRTNTEAREYTLLASSTTLTNGAAGIGGNTPKIRYRVNASSIGDLHELYWEMPGALVRPVVNPWSDGFTNPDDLRGLEYSGARSVYVHDGIGIVAAGYGKTGDTYTIEPAHTYSADKVLPHVIASTALGWVSETATTAQALSFELHTSDTYLGADCYGLFLDKINFRQIKIELEIASVWTDYGTFTLNETEGFQTIGDIVIPRTGGVSSGDNTWYNRNEVVGGTWEYPSGKTRTISKNGHGTSDAGPIDEHRPYWELEDVDGTEDASGSGARVWYPRALIILHLNGASQAAKVRFTINPSGTDPAPPGGKYRAGIFAFGPIMVLGWTPDQTRALARNLSGDVLIDQPDGSTVRDVQADQYRTVEFSWARLSRLTSFQNSGDPDYILGSDNVNAEPVSGRYDSPLAFEGLLAEIGRSPCVYIPRFERGDGAGTESYEYHRAYANGAIYGRYVPESYRLETAKGDAAKSEYVRTSVITIKEER